MFLLGILSPSLFSVGRSRVCHKLAINKQPTMAKTLLCLFFCSASFRRNDRYWTLRSSFDVFFSSLREQIAFTMDDGRWIARYFFTSSSSSFVSRTNDGRTDFAHWMAGTVFQNRQYNSFYTFEAGFGIRTRDWVGVEGGEQSTCSLVHLHVCNWCCCWLNDCLLLGFFVAVGDQLQVLRFFILQQNLMPGWWRITCALSNAVVCLNDDGPNKNVCFYRFIKIEHSASQNWRMNFDRWLRSSGFGLIYLKGIRQELTKNWS